MTETYFHFTPADTWPIIEKDGGLMPQPIKPWHPEMSSMFDDICHPIKRGIYVWPEVNRSLLRDFFLFKQVHDRSVDAGMLLAVELDPEKLLGTRWLNWMNEKTGELNTLVQHHDLAFTLADGTQRKDHVARMDIYLQVIPLRDNEPIARIYQTIEPLDNSSLAVDLGLTP